MTDASATKTKLAEVLKEASTKSRFAEAEKAKVAPGAPATAVAKNKFAEIKSNPFYAIVMDEKLSSKEKEKAIQANATYNPKLSKKENEARKDALLEMHAYLQSKATSLSEEQLAKMEVEGFGETRGVLEELGGKLLEFMGQMGEYGEIQAALEKMRNDGTALGILGEIFEESDQKDALNKQKEEIEAQKAAELGRLEQLAAEAKAKQEADLRAKQDRLAQIEADNLKRREENAVYAETKGIFGQKKEAKMAQARNEELIKQANEEIEKLNGSFAELGASATTTNQEIEEKKQQAAAQFDQKLAEVNTAMEAPYASKFAEYQNEKEVMKGLFDLSSDEHKKKISGLRDTALDFVGFARTRLGTAVDNMEKTKGDLRQQGEINDFLNDTYMLVAKGLSAANKDNVKMAKEYAVAKVDAESPNDPEDPLAKMERERTLNGINSYNDGMIAVNQSIVTQIGKINTQKGAIEGATKLNDDQIRQTQDLAASSVADTAIRLTTTFATLNNATAGEAAQTAEYMLNEMDKDNQASIGRMFESAARGLDKRKADVMKRIESVASLATTMNSFTSDATDKVAELLGTMDKLVDANKEAREALGNANAIASEVQSAREAGETPASATTVRQPANNNGDDDFMKRALGNGPK